MNKYLRYAIIISMPALLTYHSSAQQWISRHSIGKDISLASAFSINDRIYLGGGNGSNDFWEYNPTTDAWTRKADLPGTNGRRGGVGFAIGGKGYIGLGSDTTGSVFYKDLWQYDPSSDKWTARADFPATGREGAGCFVVSGKAYIVGGAAQSRFSQTWEYDPAGDQWAQKAAYPPGATIYPSAFSIGSTGYVVFGDAGSGLTNRLFSYDPSANTWTEKSAFPGVARQSGVAFALNGKGYCGLGTGVSLFSGYTDMYIYHAAADTWTQTISFPGSSRFGAASAVANDLCYVGGGLNAGDWWKFVAPVGVKSTEPADIALYPNPVQQTLHLKYSRPIIAPAMAFDISDITGQRMINGLLAPDIDISPLKPGIYFIRWGSPTDERSYALPFIKQ